MVVGFTLPYINGSSLQNPNLRFKLKWLLQLMGIVDEQNLKHGILHQDIARRNLLIDPSTDSIILIDFNLATRVGVKKNAYWGSEGEMDWGDDVRAVMFFLYRYITRTSQSS